MTSPAIDLWSMLAPLQSLDPVGETVVLVAVAIVAGAVIWVLGMQMKSRIRTENAEVVRAGLLLVLATVITFLFFQRWSQANDDLAFENAIELGVEGGVRILLTIVLFAAAYTITRILKRLLIAGGRSPDRTTTEHQRRIGFYVSQVVIYLIAAFGTFSLWGIQLSNLLLGAGVLGIVLGLAFQSTLGSILAGFVLMLSRPFEVGHWVKIGEHEGFVTEITINHVRMRNLDGEHVVLPNEAVNDRTIINRSIEGKLRDRVEVGVDYAADSKKAQSVARDALDDVEDIANQPRPQVIPMRFEESSVVLELRFWIEKPTPQRKWRAIKAVIHTVKAAFEAEGIKIPFPQRELSGRHEEDGFRIVEDDTPHSESDRGGSNE